MPALRQDSTANEEEQIRQPAQEYLHDRSWTRSHSWPVRLRWCRMPDLKCHSASVVRWLYLLRYVCQCLLWWRVNFQPHRRWRKHVNHRNCRKYSGVPAWSGTSAVRSAEGDSCTGISTRSATIRLPSYRTYHNWKPTPKCDSLFLLYGMHFYLHWYSPLWYNRHHSPRWFECRILFCLYRPVQIITSHGPGLLHRPVHGDGVGLAVHIDAQHDLYSEGFFTGCAVPCTTLWALYLQRVSVPWYWNNEGKWFSSWSSVSVGSGK